MAFSRLTGGPLYHALRIVYINLWIVSEAMKMSDHNYELYVEKKNARAEGLAEGRAEGLAEGRDDERTAVALDMLADNEPIEKIVKYSHLPESRVLELRDSRATYNSK